MELVDFHGGTADSITLVLKYQSHTTCLLWVVVALREIAEESGG